MTGEKLCDAHPLRIGRLNLDELQDPLAGRNLNRLLCETDDCSGLCVAMTGFRNSIPNTPAILSEKGIRSRPRGEPPDAIGNRLAWKPTVYRLKINSVPSGVSSELNLRPTTPDTEPS